MASIVESLRGLFSKKDLEEDSEDHYLDDYTLDGIAKRMKRFDNSLMNVGSKDLEHKLQLDDKSLMYELTSQFYGRSDRLSRQITAWLDTLDKKAKEGRFSLLQVAKDQWGDKPNVGVTIKYDLSVDSLTRVKTILFRQGIRQEFINHPEKRLAISDAIFNAISEAR